MVFEKEMDLRWADVDANFHVRHSVYADLCASARFSCLESLGFGYSKMMKVGVGPVLFKETIIYMKEIRPGGKVKVNFILAGMSESGHKFRIEHQIFRDDGVQAASLVVDGGWLDLRARKIVAPPEELVEAMNKVVKSKEFTNL